MKRSLAEWLNWQEQLHLSEIDLGLERIGLVARQLDILHPPFPVITVAGTNGKGSSVAMLDSILNAAGYKTGAYTSPHLIRYNERIAIRRKPASDAQICAAFEKIDQARRDIDGQEISLTYFEFGALAAMLCFFEQQVDIALLEVGLGGRLDAVNLWDATVALITSIAIDHENWLGNDRETIGFEKAGIMRLNQPVVCGDPNPPASIERQAQRIGARLYQINRDYSYRKVDRQRWLWSGWDKQQLTLTSPALQGDFQLNNAANATAALMALKQESPKFDIPENALSEGLAQTKLAGRLQQLQEKPEWLLDVAHNPQAAHTLANYLEKHPVKGKTFAIFSMLADKDIEQVVAIMKPYIDEWHILQLNDKRAKEIKSLKQLLETTLQPMILQKTAQETDASKKTIRDLNKRDADDDQMNINTPDNIILHKDFQSICNTLKKSANDKDRVVSFGSFLVVSGVLKNCGLNLNSAIDGYDDRNVNRNHDQNDDLIDDKQVYNGTSK